MTKRTNEEWLAALRTKSPEQEAVAELREALLKSAFFYLRRHSRELKGWGLDELRELAQDAAQESTLKVLDKLDSFRGEARFLTWASKFGVASALVSTRLRQWRDVSLDALPDGWEEPPVQAISKDGWTQPEVAAQREEIYNVLRETVRQNLTERQRQVFNYVLLQGVSAEVVAERLGVTAGALYKLTHDARRKLKKALESRGFTARDILAAFANPG